MEASSDNNSLHRAGRRPDWLEVSREHWNVWQRIAYRSHGVVTIGNVLTAVGFVLVLVGLVVVTQEQYWQALWLIAVGRACDILDGWAAHRTRTKSPLGEVLDSTADKLGTGLALLVLAWVGILPVFAILAVAVPQALIVIIAAQRLRAGRRIQPSRLGKLSMAAAWLAMGMFVYAAASSFGIIMAAAYVLSAVSALLAWGGLVGYRRV